MYYYGRYNNATNGGTTGTGTAGASSTGAAPPEPVSEYSQPDNSYYYNANNGTANTNPSNSNNTSNYYYDSNTYGYSAMGANNYDQQQPYVSAAATTQAQQPATSQQHQLNAHQQSHAPPASWGLPYSYTQQYMPPQQYQQPQQPQQYMPQTNPSTENTTSATPHHVTTATPPHPQSFQRPPIHHQMQQSNPTLLSANHSGNEYYQDYKYDPQQQTIQNTTQSVVQPLPQQMQQISQHHQQQPPHMQHPQQQQQQHFHQVKSMVPPSGTTAPTSINHNNAANATSKSPPSFQLSPNAGQIQPPGSRPKITTTMWEDEKTLCYQVESKGVSVVRRADNNMINGTKLLNVAKMTRGRRDGILKTEKIRHVVKIGSMHLKGVWIPFERALIMAQREGISDSLYPLFVKDIQKIIQQGTPTVKMGQYVINSSNGSTAAPQITDESENTRKDGKDY